MFRIALRLRSFGRRFYFTQHQCKSELEKKQNAYFTSRMEEIRNPLSSTKIISYRTPSAEALAIAKQTSTPDRPVKLPAQSWLEMVYPFSSNARLAEQYSLFGSSDARVGKILEELDAFAADTSYRHVLGTNSDYDNSRYTIVTASLDRVSFVGKLNTLRDLYVRGCVTWVGKSSMRVNLDLYNTHSPPSASSSVSASAPSAVSSPDKEEYLGAAIFTMVARDKQNYGKAALVPGLLPLTRQEQTAFAEGEEDKQKRRHIQDSSLSKAPPLEEEVEIIHNLFLAREQSVESGRFLYKGKKTALIRDTTLQHVQVNQFQDRNVHRKIFGGHLMRTAYEVAWITAAKLTASHPRPYAVDDIVFLAPVEIGTVLNYEAEVVFSDPASSIVWVQVTADCLDTLTQKSTRTNRFFFGFKIPPSTSGQTDVPFLLPSSYKEAMLYLDGRRRLLRFQTTLADD